MSTLRVDTIQDRVGTGQPDIDGLAKAWVNFNGTGTVAIRASFNVSSITDNGTGNYTVNFTNAMTDANYSATWGYTPDAMYFSGSAATRVVNIYTQSASNLVIYSGYQDAAVSGYLDFPLINITVFR